jgi:4-oxalocrotonate tautomerase
MPVVRVAWFTGKTHKQKARVAAEITDSIVRNTGTDAKYVYVLFEDVKASDWAGAGKLFGGDPKPRRVTGRKP